MFWVGRSPGAEHIFADFLLPGRSGSHLGMCRGGGGGCNPIPLYFCPEILLRICDPWQVPTKARRDSDRVLGQRLNSPPALINCKRILREGKKTPHVSGQRWHQREAWHSPAAFPRHPAHPQPRGNRARLLPKPEEATQEGKTSSFSFLEVILGTCHGRAAHAQK